MSDFEFPNGTRYRDASLSKIDFPAEISEKLSLWLNQPKGFLVFIGNPGIGKTYFCAALINHFNEKKIRTVYKTEGRFLRGLRDKMNESADYSYNVSVMANYSALWLLDDIGSSQMTEWQKEVILLFVSELYENNRPAIITSNVWLNEMASVFSPRFRSRMAAKENTIIELNGEDKRQLGL